MHRFLATALVSLLAAGCSEQPSQSATAPAAAPPAQSTPQPPPTPEPVAAVIVDVRKIAGKSQKDVASALGEPSSCETIKQGKKCSFKPGDTEVVFIADKADWITINSLDDAPYSDEALPILGIEQKPASFSNDNVMRWENIPGLLEVSIFPAQGSVDYAYVKTVTP